MTDSIARFLTSKDLSRVEKDEFAARLIAKKDYRLGYSVWASSRQVKQDKFDSILNGDFESELDEKERNFGWILNRDIENTLFNVETGDAYSNKVALQRKISAGKACLIAIGKG